MNDNDLLAMERRFFRYQGAKAETVRAELGLSLHAYYQRLHALCDTTEALAADPVTVNRVNRRRRVRT